jgi:hypothetical protein
MGLTNQQLAAVSEIIDTCGHWGKMFIRDTWVVKNDENVPTFSKVHTVNGRPEAGF